MGLLTKALSISDYPQLTESKKKKSEDWLDYSDLTLQDKTVTAASFHTDARNSCDDSGIFDESDAIGKLITFLQNALPDLHTPARLFSLIEEVFKIEKGALLLYDPSKDEYNGIAYTGYDKTTQSRLRIPSEELSAFVTGKGGGIHLGENELDKIKPFFSIREFSLLDSVILYPFFHDSDTVVGILLISDSRIDLPQFIQIFRNLETVLDQIAHIIYSSREKLLRRNPEGKIKSKDNLLQEIENAITQADNANSKLFFLTLSVLSILESLRKESESVDLFQIQNDIIHIISNMMPDGENIFLIDYGTLLIILSGRYHINKELFFHQIKTGIQSLFSTLEDITIMNYSFLEYPKDVSNANEVIQRMFD